jgi:NAD(P)-dependent dehydrogenase (short-subunit alcohol dehydrogenase family)
LPRASRRSLFFSNLLLPQPPFPSFLAPLSGLGLELTRQLLQDRGYGQVFATCRSPASATALATLASTSNGRLTVLPLDVTDEATIAAAAASVKASTGHVDLVLNAGGVLHIPGVMMPETGLARVSQAALTTCLAVNAAGPILVGRAFAPLLVAAEKAAGASEARPAVLASISARVGSITDNSLGGWYSYRASKAALNALTKTAAVEFGRKKQKVAALVLHPGTCETDLSLPFRANVPQGKLFTVQRGASQLLDIIDRATMAENGRFFAWDGQEIPW